MTAVAINQMKVILESCFLLNLEEGAGRPALLKSSPYRMVRSQKWGTCHMKKKKERITSSGSVTIPPADTQPIAGGMAPTMAPGITAKAVTFFRFV